MWFRFFYWKLLIINNFHQFYLHLSMVICRLLWRKKVFHIKIIKSNNNLAMNKTFRSRHSTFKWHWMKFSSLVMTWHESCTQEYRSSLPLHGSSMPDVCEHSLEAAQWPASQIQLVVTTLFSIWLECWLLEEAHWSASQI